MKKFLLSFLFIFIYTVELQACALCEAYTPSVLLSASVNSSQNRINSIGFRWDFSDEFIEELMLQADKNGNLEFDEEEISAIEKMLLDYIRPLDYLTVIKYENAFVDKSFDEVPSVDFEINDFKMQKENGKLFLSYILKLQVELKEEYMLFVQLKDEGDYFKFMFKPERIEIKNDSDLFLKPAPNGYILFLEVLKEKMTDEKKSDTVLPKAQEKAEVEENGLIKELSVILANIKEKIDFILKDIKDNNSPLSYFWLLFFSFVYGMVHAIGPGHGKSLVSAYFLTNEKSYMKAFNISALIGIVHTFSAFLLTFAIYFILDMFLSKYFGDIEYVATKISAVVIIAIALYLIYKKLYKKSKKYTFNQSGRQSFVLDPNHTSSSSCGCSACKTDSTDLGVVLAAGIVPCPGTVTIFIFTMSLGIYFVGFLSAVFMSVGMSLVIFLTALLSIGIRKKASKNEKITKFLEYGSLCFILLLGVVLLLL